MTTNEIRAVIEQMLKTGGSWIMTVCFLDEFYNRDFPQGVYVQNMFAVLNVSTDFLFSVALSRQEFEITQGQNKEV